MIEASASELSTATEPTLYAQPLLRSRNQYLVLEAHRALWLQHRRPPYRSELEAQTGLRSGQVRHALEALSRIGLSVPTQGRPNARTWARNIDPVREYSVDTAERNAIVAALDFTGGNARLAARLLGIGRVTLHRRVDMFELKPLLSSIRCGLLPKCSRPPPTMDQAMRWAIIAALLKSNGCIRRAAALLRVGRTALYRGMRSYDLGDVYTVRRC